jgi:serine/threonine protein kinase
MSQPNPAQPASPSLEREAHVDQTCDRFEAQWRAGKRPRVEDFLTGCAVEALRQLLRQLLLLELEYRSQSGEKPTREDYRGRFAGHDAVLDALFAAGPSSLGHAGRTLPHAGQAASDTPTPQVPGYEVLGVLGRGGMGVVYRARQLGFNREVALKMIRAGSLAEPEEQQRFLAEAEAIAAVKHPGIVQVFDFGTHDGLPFFSLEFCEGGSLAGKLAANPLPPQEAARLVERVARSVQAAHEAGIVHRDLKPGNVLLSEDGTPKVTDFGLAKRIEAGPGLTQTGAIVGTPSYMAPEQAQGKKEVGSLADVYALGAVLYECLAGRPPFKADTTLDTLLQVIHDEPALPRQLNPKVPADLETVCLKCLEKEPGRRYRAAEELADDLHRFLEGGPITARRSGLWERPAKWARRSPALVALIVLSFLIVTENLLVLPVFLTRSYGPGAPIRDENSPRPSTSGSCNNWTRFRQSSPASLL